MGCERLSPLSFEQPLYISWSAFFGLGNFSRLGSRGPEFKTQPGHIIFVEIVHENISTAICPLLLIQEGYLSVSGESIFT